MKAKEFPLVLQIRIYSVVNETNYHKVFGQNLIEKEILRQKHV